jgi:hypothetical protein
MPLRWENAKALPTCPQQPQQKKKQIQAAIPHRPCDLIDAREPTGQNASQIGEVGDIVSESPGDGIRGRLRRASTHCALQAAT